MMDPKALAAKTWFGYGRWSAPYWFVGKEPGGADEPEQYASWQQLGGGELIDCGAHDPTNLWHGPPPGPKLQPTWRPLIALLLAFEGAETWKREMGRRCQDERWGRLDGDTAVIELSAVAAPSLAHHDPLRLDHLTERIATLRARLARKAPGFVVFYGLGVDPAHGVPYLDRWREIAGTELEVGVPVRIGDSVFVAEKHPTAHGTTTEHWMNLGRQIRALLDAR